MSRVPIRIRVTLAFTGAMAVLLTALGAFVWLELRNRLNESIDDTLQSRLDEVAGLAAGGTNGNGEFVTDEDETFVQIVGANGAVRFGTPLASDRPLIEPADVAPGEAVTRDEVEIPGAEGPARLLASRSAGTAGDLVIVGASLDDRDETLTGLATLLLIGGPIALLIASGIGYLVAGRALAPVEAMRTRAEALSAAEPGARLPLPEADDELRRLGTTLNEMLARLEEAIERERQFVNDASHELRTPLALQKTELELALRYGNDEAELRAAIASAGDEVDRLIQLAEDLLVVARSSGHGLSLVPELLSADRLMETVADRFRGRAERGSRLIRTVPSDGLELSGDRLRLEQALTNMIENALRYGEGDVELRAEPLAGTVRIHVTDSGGGFPAEFLPHAFERLSRAEPGRTTGGSGLGLAIVSTIAEAHGGSAGARNNPGGGADVWIEVPAQ